MFLNFREVYDLKHMAEIMLLGGVSAFISLKSGSVLHSVYRVGKNSLKVKMDKSEKLS